MSETYTPRGVVRTREELRAEMVHSPERLAMFDAASDADVAPFLDWTRDNQILAIKGSLKWLVWWAWDCGALPKWSMRSADFRFADLSGAQLQGCQLSHADFRGAKLVGAELDQACLRCASFYAADLQDASLDMARLTDADFSFSDLREADFTGAYTLGIQLGQAKIDGSYGLPAASNGWKPSGAELYKRGRRDE